MGTFPRVGDTFAGYEIESVLGRGAMGVVFRARQRRLDRSVALKVVAPSYAELSEFRARFSREATLLASVDSPHIISLYDHGEQDGCLYTVTQLVTGADLGQIIEREGVLEPDRALRVTAQIASALSAAHEAGVVHRDVKPSNVMLRTLDGRDHAYLCDFGIARGGHPDAQGLTSTGLLLGSYGYLSPECCNGERATTLSDLYSLGCLLFTMLTGAAPYDGTEYQVMRQHVEGEVPRWVGPGATDRRLDRVIQRAMAKRPADRYTSAREMQADLLADPRSDGADHALEGAPAGAPTIVRASTGPSRALALVPDASPRRRPLLWLLAGLVALAVTAAATYGLASTSSGNEPTRRMQSAQGPSPVVTPSAGPTATAGPARRCWDGSTAAESTACYIPSGKAGLRYVFPSFESALAQGDCEFRANEIDAPATRGMLQSYRCRVDLPGADAFLNYGYWRTWELDAAHYRAKYGSAGTPQGQFLVFAPARVGMTRGALQTSRVFRDRAYRFSVTAIAYTPGDLAEAMAQLKARTVARTTR